MLRSLWISKTGMDAQQFNLDVIANNLANSSTVGFKRVQPMFQDLMYTTLRAAGASSNAQNLLPTGLQIGAGSAITSTERNNIQGPLVQTQNNLDGTLAYTRNGQFSLSATGTIVTSAGNTVAGAGVIPPTATNIVINQAGVVQYSTQGTTALTQAGQITMASFANPAGLTSLGGGNFIPSPASGTPQNNIAGTNGMGSLSQYYMENSNVNVAEELVNLIAAQRAYEINTRAVNATDQILQRVSNMGQ